MFTPITNISFESSDIISYAKWFSLQGITFSLNMKDPSSWTASCSFRSFVDIETSVCSGPTLAIMELQKLIKSMLESEKNV
jgi:hypothetical protein